MRDQGVARQVERQAERRIDPGDAAVELDPEAGLGIAVVVARVDLELGCETAPALGGDAPATDLSLEAGRGILMGVGRRGCLS